MCTYDYTPYTGCGEGQQHFYTQWMKCHRALENNKYCDLEKSTEVEVLRKLSTNVLSCPLHGPIAVQQQIFDSFRAENVQKVAARSQHEDAERPRTRTTARRGRTPRSNTYGTSSEQAPCKEVRKRRAARDAPPASSDSESLSDSPIRPRAADGMRKPGDRGVPERRKSPMVRENLHRRASSAELLPPARVLPMRHGRSEVSLPLKAEPQAQAEDAPKQVPPKNTLKIPAGKGIIGLPSSPDMLHRAKSEGLLRQGKESQGEPLEPTARNTISPSSDSSPDPNSEQLPFSNGASRRGRRAGARSIRDRSVDTVMRRIDEHFVAESIDAPEAGGRQSTSLPRASTSTASRSSTSTESQSRDMTPSHSIIATTSSGAPIYRSEDSRPRLHTLQIPKQGDQHFHGASPASAASPPQQDTPQNPLQTRKSFRYGNSPASTASLSMSPQRKNDETSSIRSTKSRRFEEQVAEGRKWAAAREHHMPSNSAAVATASRSPLTDVLAAHMSEPHLPLAAPAGMAVLTAAAAGRESIDSGYRSGPGYQQQQHHRQRSRDVTDEKEAGIPGAGAAGKRLQKVVPPQPLELVVGGRRDGPAQAPEPEQWPLGLGGLPPCALPVSLMSPGLQSEFDVSVGKAAKVPLLQRMGLRRKFSGMLWDRGGQREVGVEG